MAPACSLHQDSLTPELEEEDWVRASWWDLLQKPLPVCVVPRVSWPEQKDCAGQKLVC